MGIASLSSRTCCSIRPGHPAATMGLGKATGGDPGQDLHVRLRLGTPGGGSDECGGTILQPEMVYDDLDREIWQAPLSAQGMEVVMTNNATACIVPRGRWVVELSAVSGVLTVGRWSPHAPTAGAARTPIAIAPKVPSHRGFAFTLTWAKPRGSV